MNVKVAYWNKKTNCYASWEYTYKTNLPLKVGDKVLAPTQEKDKQKAIVTAINVPDSEISPHWVNRIKTITEYDTEQKNTIKGERTVGDSRI